MQAKRYISAEQIEVVDHQMVACLKAMSGAERLSVSWRLLEVARGLIESSIRARHPHLTDEEVRREAVKRFLRDAA